MVQRLCLVSLSRVHKQLARFILSLCLNAKHPCGFRPSDKPVRCVTTQQAVASQAHTPAALHLHKVWTTGLTTMLLLGPQDAATVAACAAAAGAAAVAAPAAATAGGGWYVPSCTCLTTAEKAKKDSLVAASKPAVSWCDRNINSMPSFSNCCWRCFRLWGGGRFCARLLNSCQAAGQQQVNSRSGSKSGSN